MTVALDQRVRGGADRVITQRVQGRAVPVRRARAKNEHSARGDRSDLEE